MSQLSQRVSAARPPQDSAVPAHLQCNSCSGPLFNGFQTPHGCRLCQTCVTSLLPATEKRLCPGKTEACRDETEEIELSQASCLPDMATRREVSRLVVTCPNTDAGCNEKLKWAQMDKHLDECNFQSASCELCSKQVVKKDMQRHVNYKCEQRKVECNLCRQMVVNSEMKTKHQNLESNACCSKFSAPCPHCKDPRKLDRRAYVLHLSECPEKPVDCKYAHLGCTVRVRRSEMPMHYREDSDSHLELMDVRLREAASATSHYTADASPATAASDTTVVTPATPATASTAGGSQEVADVKRRVGSVYEQFKRLQVNVANWAHSTMQLEQMADRFGGVQQLRTLLTSLEERNHTVDRLQQQVQQLQQQVQQLQRTN